MLHPKFNLSNLPLCLRERHNVLTSFYVLSMDLQVEVSIIDDINLYSTELLFQRVFTLTTGHYANNHSQGRG